MYEEKEIKKRLTIEIPISKHIEIKMNASARGMSIKEFIEEILYDYGDRMKKKVKK